MDPLRLVDVRAGDGEQTQGYGSGYLIAPRLVLTAWHVTRQRGSGLLWPRIHVYIGLPSAGPVEHRTAEVRWTHPDGRDVALLELSSAVDVPGEVLWGRVGGTPPVHYSGLAFPLATRTADGHRKVEQLHGTLPPLAGGRGVHNLYALNQAIAPGEREDGKQAWAGASGAAIFCDDHLVGVVIHDDEAFRNHRLHACPTHTFVTDRHFTDLLREHNVVPPATLMVIEGGPVPVPVPVPAAAPRPALPSWLSPLPAGPSGRFVGREAELRNARSLLSGGRVLSVVGPEHTGKSAFIGRLVGDEDFRRALGGNRPWGLLELDVPGCGSRFPVSRALATQLDVNLFTVEEYGEDTTSTERKIKHMLGTLSGAARGHDIVTVIDCARFGEDTADLEADLDEVLGNFAFRQSAVLIASVTHLQANGGLQLRHMPPVRLGPLSPEEAAELLSAELDERHVRVDARQVIDEADDSLVQRPGILLFGVDQHVSQYVDAGPHDADPVVVAVDLLNACHIAITRVFEEFGLRVLDDSGSRGALALLIVWAMAGPLPLPQDVLVTAGVGPEALQRLAAQGVLLERQPSAGPPGPAHYELSRATREALRNMTLVALGVDRKRRLNGAEAVALGPAARDPELLDRTLREGALAFFEAARSHFEDEEGDDRHRALLFAVECTVGWLRARADDRLPRLSLLAEEIANTLDVEAIVLPVQPSGQQEQLSAPEAVAAVSSGARPHDGYEALYRAVSQLNVRMREPVTARAEAGFVAACEQAVDALCGCAPGLPPQMLRSIDNALYFGGRRYRCDTDMLRIRASAARVLSEDAQQIAKGRVSRLAWTISWLLNTADLQLDGQQLSEGRSSVGRVRELLELLPPPNTTGGEATQLGLRMRASRAQARTADNEPERLEALAEAVRLGHVALERCAPTPALRHLWTRRFLEAAKHHALELRTDEERFATVRLVTDCLTGPHGPVPSWGLPVRLAVARFLRSVHRRQADPALRLDGANAAMDLLLPYGDTLVQQAAAGDADGLLELARTAGFKAWALEENELLREAAVEAGRAERYAVRAVDSAPSARAYRVWLDCLRHREQIEGGSPEDSATRRDLRRAVSRTQDWLATQEARAVQHARLARLCIVEEWHLRGRSLWRAAVEANDGNPVIRLDLLRRVYADRVRTLDGHEKRYGPTVGTALLRCDLEREHQRILTVHQPGNGKAGRHVDNGPAWAVLDRAESLWPHSTEIRLARARLHRYQWDYAEAATILESVIRTTRSGQERRQAQIDMADALLRSVRHGSPDPSEREAALERAAAQLVEPLGHRFQSQRVAVLRERIRLESGASVDQERIDAAFEELIGLDYATSIGSYLHSRRYAPAEPAVEEGGGGGPDDEPQDLTRLLYDNFTDIDLIDGLGQLYLRQAELWDAEDAPDAKREAAIAARRAYDCFDACRVLLEARFGKEHLVNCFQRAEAIRQAARLAGTANPLAWKPEGKPSWLKLAVDLFQSAAGRSVGTFHVLCVGRIKETQHLLNQLTG